MLDKNPDLENSENISDFIKILESNTLNLIIHSDPFLKTSFLNKLILTTNNPVIYLDLDLLFSGYIASNSIKQSEKMTLYHPTRKEILETIKTILLEISQKKFTLIIDSLNGLFTLFHDNKDAGRLVNSYIMLFCSIAKKSNSCILISGMIRRKNNEEWALSLTGRHVLETKQMNTIRLEKQNSSIIVNVLDEKIVPKKSFKISIQTELL